MKRGKRARLRREILKRIDYANRCLKLGDNFPGLDSAYGPDTVSPGKGVWRGINRREERGEFYLPYWGGYWVRRTILNHRKDRCY